MPRKGKASHTGNLRRPNVNSLSAGTQHGAQLSYHTYPKHSNKDAMEDPIVILAQRKAAPQKKKATSLATKSWKSKRRKLRWHGHVSRGLQSSSSGALLWITYLTMCTMRTKQAFKLVIIAMILLFPHNVFMNKRACVMIPRLRHCACACLCA